MRPLSKIASILAVLMTTALGAAPPNLKPLAIVDLGTLPGGVSSEARAINNRGDVVGVSTDATGATHAVLWRNGRIADLGTLGGVSSEPLAINARGQVVGISTTASGEAHAFLWERGSMQDLGTLG